MTGMMIIDVVLTTLSILVLVPIAVFSVECLTAVLLQRKVKKRHCRLSEKDARTAVLIPAHNEQLLIEQTIDAVFSTGAPSWGGSCTATPRGDSTTIAPTGTIAITPRVLVVADNCDDRTAELAVRAGAEVVVRTDSERRGKGFALQSGLKYLQENPPEVVIILDADCQPQPGTIDTLAQHARNTQRPVQAMNLTDRNPASGPFEVVSILGNRFTNMVRPLGLLALGLPCRLTGTGMAIPWRLIDNVPLAGGNLVEDMQWGIDLALQGHLPLFCPEARVSSALPPEEASFVSQRTRWDHGHLRTAVVQIPRLLAQSVRRRSWALLALALDLSVLPMTLLVALWFGAAILAGAAWWFGASWAPVALLAGGGTALAAALGLGWGVFCRRQTPLWAFAAVPLYMLRKLPVYTRLIFHRQHTWVRTDRTAADRRPLEASQTNSRTKR